MDSKNKIGHVARAAVDHAQFALSNQSGEWIKHSKAIRESAAVLQAAYLRREKEVEVEIHRMVAAQTGPRGSYAFSGEFQEGDNHPMMHMVELRRSQMPILLLAGLAIETVLKALWIQRDPDCVTKGVGPLSHKQVDLAVKAGVSLSTDEVALLLLLSDMVVFAGRYPTAAKAVDAHSGMTIGSDIYGHFEKLFNRLLGIYKAQATP